MFGEISPQMLNASFRIIIVLDQKSKLAFSQLCCGWLQVFQGLQVQPNALTSILHGASARHMTFITQHNIYFWVTPLDKTIYQILGSDWLDCQKCQIPARTLLHETRRKLGISLSMYRV